MATFSWNEGTDYAGYALVAMDERSNVKVNACYSPQRKRFYLAYALLWILTVLFLAQEEYKNPTHVSIKKKGESHFIDSFHESMKCY